MWEKFDQIFQHCVLVSDVEWASGMNLQQPLLLVYHGGCVRI